MWELDNATYAKAFETPLMVHIWSRTAELNEALRTIILAHKQATNSQYKSNEGGWHSETGQLEFCGDAGKQLVGWMYDMAEEATRRVFLTYGKPHLPMRWSLSAWVNVNADGEFNRTHTHPGSTWSGTYYVDDGDPINSKDGTPLHLLDPCPGRGGTFLNQIVPPSLLIVPEPGKMVIFPSYLPHMVFPHRGSRPRISIAFNLRREPYP